VELLQHTPWFFQGVRVQIYTSEHLKIEPWLVNGWQSYGKFNEAPGIGLQLRWWPDDSLSVLGNQYFGKDTLGLSDRKRFHSDNSIMYRYHDSPGDTINRAAVSLTVDAGFETGDGGHADDQYFLGFMAYHRAWFFDNRFALTFGGGAINNPGRYLVLMPPINGATAFSGTPYFTAAPGDPFRAWDLQATGDYMPTENVTFRLEFNRRVASVPYFAGEGGVTPPGGNQGDPGSSVPGFEPDLDRAENRVTFALMVRF
jgi:hypothetical protein